MGDVNCSKIQNSRLRQVPIRGILSRVIESFSDKQTERLWNGERHKLPVEIEDRAANKLSLLAAAVSLDELRIPPSNHLEALKGDRAGQHSIRINSQYRLCFHWNNGNPRNVEITDYH